MNKFFFFLCATTTSVLLLPVTCGQRDILVEQPVRYVTKDLSKLNLKQSCGCLWEGKPFFFFYLYPSRYFGAGADSDLMMAPDDGSSIMTHPEGKEGGEIVWLAV